MSWLLVLLGGAVGAPVRYLAERVVRERARTAVPVGTLVVNVAGCFVLGALAGVASTDARLLLGTGFCGALTTFSAFGYETTHLLERHLTRTAVAYVALSLVLGLAAATLGVSLAT